MKFPFCLVVIASLLSFGGKSQTIADVARAEKITWYGIDFSETRFINIEESFDTGRLSAAIPRWSREQLDQNDIDRLQRIFRVKSLDTNIQTGRRRNRGISYSSRVTKASFEMDLTTIRKVVNGYEFGGEGYGVLLIVESFDKHNIRAFVWAVFIDKASKKIITARRMVCRPSHGTIEDYWDEAIKNAIEQSGKYLSHS